MVQRYTNPILGDLTVEHTDEGVKIRILGDQHTFKHQCKECGEYFKRKQDKVVHQNLTAHFDGGVY